MKQWFQKLGYKISRFMYGRYGNDELTTAILIASLVLILISAIPLPFFFLFAVAAWLLMFWSIFRSFSRNIAKRRRELECYLRIKNKPRNALKLRKNKKRDKNTHVYFKCPKCKSVLRVPLGKGSIIVTCPRCNEKIEKNT